mgnify:CR=1 FL=1
MDNYKRVVGMAKEQLLQYGFVEQNIFPACAIAAFAEPPERMRGVVQNIERKLEEYPGLADGFHDCVAAVKHCVSRDLPIRRVKEAADLVPLPSPRWPHVGGGRAGGLPAYLMPAN